MCCLVERGKGEIFEPARRQNGRGCFGFSLVAVDTCALSAGVHRSRGRRTRAWKGPGLWEGERRAPVNSDRERTSPGDEDGVCSFANFDKNCLFGADVLSRGQPGLGT